MPYRVVKSSRFSIQEVKQNLDAIPDVQGKVEEAQRMRREEVVFHTQGKVEENKNNGLSAPPPPPCVSL